MELFNTYEEYTRLNKEYTNFIDTLIESDLSKSDEKISEKLKSYQNSFEDIKVKCDTIEVEDNDINNLKDLKYLVVDTLFLSLDLVHFYNYKEFERFKMRAVNYINKRRRADFV